MADIDNLTIQITAEASAAIDALTKLAGALNAVNDALKAIRPSKLDKVATATESVSKAASSLGSSAESIKEVSTSLNNLGKESGNLAKLGDSSQNVKKRLGEMTQPLTETARKIKDAGETAKNSGGFKELANNIKNATSLLLKSKTGWGVFTKAAKFGLKALIAPARLAVKAIKGIGKASDETTKTAKKLAKELTRVGKMLKLMVTRMALRAVIKEVGNGFKSLALHSEQFNQSVSSMINGSKKLGYSFSAMVSPLINAFAPAIVYVINLLVKLANIINQVFSALTGAGSWNKAKDFTNDWAKDIAGANKEAKELKKTVLGFDELNQLQEKQTGGGDTSNNIVDMFETLPIEDKWKKVADTIKKYAKKLFEPIKKAWEKVGDFVKKSWKYALDEIKKLGASVARDFWKMWEQKATQQIFENILKIIGYIGVAVGNLAKRFREAWDKNNTGYKILCNIRDIVLTITEHLKNMAKATAEWADNLDFSPLLEKFNEWLKSMKPAIDNLMGVLEDFYTTVILPLGEWAVEKGAPQLLQVFIDFNEKVKWNELREKLKTLWEHLEPFAETVGEGLIKFIDDCAQSLANFINSETFENFLTKIEEWMDSVDPEDVAKGLKAICAAILGYKVLTSVTAILVTVINFISTLTKISGAFASGAKAIADGFKFIVDSIKGLVAIFQDPSFVSLSYILSNPASVFALSNLMDFLRGTWLDPDEWSNLFGQIYDYFGIAYNDLIYWGMLLITGWKDIKDGLEIGTTNESFGFKWQSFKEYNEAMELLEKNGKDVGGTYEDLIRRANLLKEEQTTGLDIAAGAAGALKTNIGGLQADYDALTAKSDEAAESNKKFKTTSDASAGSVKIYANNTAILNDKQRSLATSIKNAKDETNKLKDSSDKVTTSYGDQTTKAGSLNEALKNASNAYKNVKTGMEEPVKYAPVLDKAQQDIITSMGGVIDESGKLDETTAAVWESFELNTANAEVSFAGTAYEIQKSMDETAGDIKKQNDDIAKAFSKDKWTFKGVWEGLEDTFKKAKDKIKGIWNSIAEKLNGEHLFGSEKMKINLPKFAGGGFPENGLFLANSTELVGRFSNGKTAVANNEQIVQGISAGVYNAVSAAMANSNSNGGGYIANTIVVDGEVIARTVTKAQQRQQMRFSPQMG